MNKINYLLIGFKKLNNKNNIKEKFKTHNLQKIFGNNCK